MYRIATAGVALVLIVLAFVVNSGSKETTQTTESPPVQEESSFKGLGK